MTAGKKHTKEEIRDQLERIVQDPGFKASDRQKQFLKFVVEETLEGRSSQIKGYTIATAVYGRAENFDPQVDPIVRVEAGRLRRTLEHYYLTIGKNDPLCITIPKGTYVPAFQSVQMPQPKAKNLVTEMPDNLSGEPTIAVMPLINLDGEMGQEYFADGLTEELTTELARYQDIRVIASQSTMRFKNQESDPRIVGKDLGARYLLTGSIRKDVKTIKITIRLMDAFTVEQIWGKSYNRNHTADNLIAIQEEIAYSVSGTIADQYGLIKRTLSKQSRKKPPVDLKAYDAVLRFYHYETELTPEVFNTAFEALEQAIEVDPDYGMAHSMLGHLHADNYALGFRKIEAPLELALTYAQKGMALEPQSQFAHDALTLVYFHLGDKASFLRQVDETIELNPNSPYIVGVAGWHLALWGEWDRGLALLEKGMKLNPYYPTWFHLASFINHFRLGNYAEAYTEASKFNIPGLFWDPLMRAVALNRLGKRNEAAAAIQQLIELENDFATQGRSLISRYVKTEDLKEELIKGLRKAGLVDLE